MKIGIIAAEPKEMNAIKKRMTNISEKTIYDMTFNIGNFYSHEIYLVECGVGKVNAARTTQLLIDSFNIGYIINVGSAGAVNPLDGNVYVPDNPVTSSIVPLPPLASNETLYVPIESSVNFA